MLRVGALGLYKRSLFLRESLRRYDPSRRVGWLLRQYIRRDADCGRRDAYPTPIFDRRCGWDYEFTRARLATRRSKRLLHDFRKLLRKQIRPLVPAGATTPSTSRTFSFTHISLPFAVGFLCLPGMNEQLQLERRMEAGTAKNLRSIP